MLKRGLIIGLLLGVCLFGCGRNAGTGRVATERAVSALLKEAENKSHSQSERLHFALQADSIATAFRAPQGQIDAGKILADLYAKMDSPYRAIECYYNVADVARNASDTADLGIALNNIGAVYNNISEYDSALVYYGRGLRNFEAIGDRRRVAQGLINIGIVYKNLEDYERASKITVGAAKILDSLNDRKDLASVYSTLGNIEKEQRRYDEALGYHEQALEIRAGEQDSLGMAGALNNIGNVYKAKAQYTSALSYYRRSLQLKERLSAAKGIATTLNNIAEVHLLLNSNDSAEMFFLRALGLKDAAKDKEGYINTLNKLAKLYLSKNELRKAESLSVSAGAMMPKTGFLKHRSENALLLGHIYQQLGDFEKAVRYVDLSKALKDSLFTAGMDEKVMRLNMKFRATQREKELVLSKQAQREQAFKLKVQFYFIILLVSVLVLLCVLSVQLYRAAQFRKRARQQVETLMSELNHRVQNNLQLLSDILNLQMQLAKEPELAATIATIRNRVQSMGILHSLLYKREYNGTIEMKDFFESLLLNLTYAYEDKRSSFEVQSDIAGFSLSAKQAIPLGLIVNELVTNIYKYAKVGVERPVLMIAAKEENGSCKLTLTDNFGYWDVNAAKPRGGGLGLVLVKTLVRQLGGKHELSVDAHGTEQVIEFQKEA